MHAARIRPGPVEKADALRVFRRRNVEQFEIPGQRTVICPSALGHSSLPSAGSREIVAAPARQSPCRTKLPFLRHPGLGQDDDLLRLLRSWGRRLFRALLVRRTRGLGRGERQRRGREAGGRVGRLGAVGPVITSKSSRGMGLTSCGRALHLKRTFDKTRIENTKAAFGWGGFG